MRRLLLLLTAIAGGGASLPQIARAESRITRLEIRANRGLDEVWVGSPRKWEKMGEILVIPRGTSLYHWSRQDRGLSWIKPGGFTGGDPLFSMADPKNLNRGGVFLSTGCLDSLSYGGDSPWLTIFSAQEDLRLVKPTSYKWATYGGSELANLYRLMKVAGLRGTLSGTPTKSWLKIIDAGVIQPRPGTAAEVNASPSPLSPLALLQLDQNYPIDADSPLAKANPTFNALLKDQTLGETEASSFYRELEASWADDAMQATRSRLLARDSRAINRIRKGIEIINARKTRRPETQRSLPENRRGP